MALSCGRAQPPAEKIKTPPEQIVRVETRETTVTAGGRAEAIFHLTIADGYHINANPPTNSYMIATELKVDPAEGIKVAELAYPPPLQRKFAFAEAPLDVYEKAAPIRLTLEAAPGATKGTRSLRARLRVQACDEEVCYAPKTLETSLPLKIE